MYIHNLRRKKTTCKTEFEDSLADSLTDYFLSRQVPKSRASQTLRPMMVYKSGPNLRRHRDSMLVGATFVYPRPLVQRAPPSQHYLVCGEERPVVLWLLSRWFSAQGRDFLQLIDEVLTVLSAGRESVYLWKGYAVSIEFLFFIFAKEICLCCAIYWLDSKY